MTSSITHPARWPEPISDEAGPVAGEPGPRPPETAAPVIDDRLIRVVGIPGFGLIIPQVTDLFAGVSPSSTTYWLGVIYFIGLAGAIWNGNRWLLFEQRRHLGWFDHPARKVMLLLAAIVLYTAPVTVVGLLIWYGWRGAPIDAAALESTALINVICVVFVTHVYETVFLIKERETDRLRLSRLETARAEAELASFVAQVDPHFLFNSLNTLGYLIERDPGRAGRYTEHLADLYRYRLRHRGRATASIADELEFLASYLALLELRFEGDLRCRILDATEAPAGAALPTATLQLLVENAVVHNQVGPGSALTVDIVIGPRGIRVENRRRPRRTARPSAGVGLINLDERSRLASGRGIEITADAERFAVEVPFCPAPSTPLRTGP
jgi:hypothetical protein